MSARKRLIYTVAAADRDAAEKRLHEQLGEGWLGTFGTPLSADGTGEPTHYAGSGVLTAEEAAAVEALSGVADVRAVRGLAQGTDKAAEVVLVDAGKPAPDGTPAGKVRHTKAAALSGWGLRIVSPPWAEEKKP